VTGNRAEVAFLNNATSDEVSPQGANSSRSSVYLCGFPKIKAHSNAGPAACGQSSKSGQPG
jgi:hypothetical protein